jgi:hypothetical protein
MLFSIANKTAKYEFDRIEDFALDPANHMYLLTKSPRAILIFNPRGVIMRTIMSDQAALNFEDAKLIAVGPSGSIFLVDKGGKRIMKLG